MAEHVGIFPGPEGPVCDFCSARGPTWRYPVSSFVAYEVQGVVGESVGDWAACDACHALIEADQRDALVRRSLEMMPHRGEVPPDVALAFIRKAHTGFFLNRRGPAVWLGPRGPGVVKETGGTEARE